MRQPIKFLPYLKSTPWGGEEISRFKGLKINCKNIGESWELSAVAGCESIVMDGDDCGMTLPDMVAKYKDGLVGESVYNRYGDNFPVVVKFINAADQLSVQMSAPGASDDCRYSPTKGNLCDETELLLNGECIHVHKEVVAGERRLINRHDSFMGLVCVGGYGSLKVDGKTTSVKQGETLLIPAHTEEFDVEGTMALLTIVVPTLMAGAEA